MTSSNLANRDKTFWSSLWRGYAGNPRIRFWDYDWHNRCQWL